MAVQHQKTYTISRIDPKYNIYITRTLESIHILLSIIFLSNWHFLLALCCETGKKFDQHRIINSDTIHITFIQDFKKYGTSINK